MSTFFINKNNGEIDIVYRKNTILDEVTREPIDCISNTTHYFIVCDDFLYEESQYLSQDEVISETFSSGENVFVKKYYFDFELLESTDQEELEQKKYLEMNKITFLEYIKQVMI